MVHRCYLSRSRSFYKFGNKIYQQETPGMFLEPEPSRNGNKGPDILYVTYTFKCIWFTVYPILTPFRRAWLHRKCSVIGNCRIISFFSLKKIFAELEHKGALIGKFPYLAKISSRQQTDFKAIFFNTRFSMEPAASKRA